MPELFTRNGRFEDADGNPVVLWGVSHHGFSSGSSNPVNADDNNPYNMPTGLWNQLWQEQLDSMATFANCVRLCVNPDTLHSTVTYDDGGRYVNGNSDIGSWTPPEFLEEWLAYADSLGLMVILDMHQISGLDRNNVWCIYDPASAAIHLWNGQPYTVADWLNDLQALALLSLTYTNIIGIEPYNEPHGWTRWGPGDNYFDGQMATNEQLRHWSVDLHEAALAIHAINPTLLIFVQGTDNVYDVVDGNPDSFPLPYGGCFQWLVQNGIDLPPDKLVLCPHLYGPDVAKRYYGYDVLWDDPNFPEQWRAWLDFIVGDIAAQGYTICPTEIGGRYGSADPLDDDANDELVTWLREHRINSAIWWTFFNSWDSGAIREPDAPPFVERTDKIALMDRLTAPFDVEIPTEEPAPSPSTEVGENITTTTTPVHVRKYNRREKKKP